MPKKGIFERAKHFAPEGVEEDRVDTHCLSYKAIQPVQTGQCLSIQFRADENTTRYDCDHPEQSAVDFDQCPVRTMCERFFNRLVDFFGYYYLNYSC